MNGHATSPTSPLDPTVASTPVSSTPTIGIPLDRPWLGLGPRDAGTGTGGQTGGAPSEALWPHRLSASFSAMADQIATASQALALVPSTAFSGSDVGAELGALKSRLEAIERTQERMAGELEALKTQLQSRGNETGRGGQGEDKDKSEGEGGADDPAKTHAAKLAELEKKLVELSETMKLE